MPLLLTLKNGAQLAIQGEGIKVWGWKRKGLKMVKALNGHELVVSAGEVCIIEYIPLDEYQKRLEQAKQEREGKGGRIARPVMTIPRK